MTKYRAAYIPGSFGSNSAGTVLTTPDQAALADADLLTAALPALAENNANLNAIGEPSNSESDIVIGDWTE